MIRYLLVVFALIASFSSYGQQAFQLSQWTFDKYMTNPAYAGLEGCLHLHGGYRAQWVGFENAPRTMYVSGHRDFGRESSWNRGWHGVGGQIMRDTHGPFEVISFTPSYAYHLRLNKQYTLSMGLAAGFQQHFFRPTIASIPTSGDPLIGGAGVTFIFPELKAGVWLSHKKGYAGLSVDNIYRTKMSGFGGGGIGSPSKLKKHYYLALGKQIKMDHYYITWEPYLLVKYMYLYPPAIDVGCKVYMKENLGFGLGYRTIDGFVGMVELNLTKRIRMGYAFDFNTSRIRVGSSNGHELMLRFVHCFKNEVRSIQFCPAY